MSNNQYKILLEFREPVVLSEWNFLNELIKFPKDEIYLVDTFRIFTNDVYKCVSYMVSTTIDIDEKIIYDQFKPKLYELRKSRNPYSSIYHNNPELEEFYDVEIIVTKVT